MLVVFDGIGTNFASEYSLVTRCCAKEERQRGSDEGEKTEKKARRAGGGGSRGTSRAVSCNGIMQCYHAMVSCNGIGHVLF